MKYIRGIVTIAVMVVAMGAVQNSAHAETGPIAFDNASTGMSLPGSSLTYSHEVSATGTNRILFVNVEDSGAAVNSVTYASSSLTLIGSDYDSYSNESDYLYYMVAPATGTHNVVITLSASNYFHSSAVSYTGASQTDVPEAYATAHGTASGSTYSQSLTTLSDNSWVVMGARDCGGGTVSGVGAGTTQRAVDGENAEELVDSGGPVSPAGSKTLNVTGTGTDRWASVIAAFKPWWVN